MTIVTATITCNGQVLPETIDVLSIEVRRDLNRVPEARIVLNDGEPADGSFAVSDANHFQLGTTVRIALRWEGEGSDTDVFEGLVVRQAISASEDGGRLRVELKDRSVLLTRERHTQVFREMSDADAIGKLVSAAGLKKGVIRATSTTHPELVQFQASDWDFILSRADVLGLVVDAHMGTIAVEAMAPSGAAARSFTWGIDEIFDVDLELDGASQWAEVSAESWSIADQKIEGPQAAKTPSVRVGDVDAKKVAEVLGGATCRLMHPGPGASDELQAWADARLLRSRLALLRGRIVVPGDPKLKPRDIVDLVSIGKRYNGEALVSGLTHRVDAGGWTTELRLGLDPAWYARRPDIAEPPAAGLLPPMPSGLQIGVVAALEGDPAGELRIQVTLPSLPAENGHLWARCARPDAGKDRGFVFWPEIGDEVVVGFFGGDPRHPVVLGALFSSKLPPPAAVDAPTDANPKRALVSRSGCLLGFDDEKKQITLQTPAGQQLMLDDDGKLITLTDQHGNKITLDQNGIVLKSIKDFTIDAASGAVTIKGSTVDIQ